MSIKSDLTLIVVEYFSRPHLDILAESIRSFEPDLPVLISSNSGYDTKVQQQYEREFPTFKWLHHGINLGYASAVNKALTKVETSYAAILNPDVELIESIAEKTKLIFEADLQIAIFGPRVLDNDGKETYSFRRFYPPQYIFTRYLGFLPTKLKQRMINRYLMVNVSRNKFTYADWISGGAMFVRMNAVGKVNKMDDRYFLYMEDVDWCRLFWNNGWRVAYHPEITLIHRAQHQTTRGGLINLFSKPTRHHLLSYAKYVMKWGLAPYHPADEINE